MAMVILNFRFTPSTISHNSLHGFQAVCCTGTASFDAKLIHYLMAMRQEVLYAIFLDQHKTYDAFDRNIFLEIF